MPVANEESTTILMEASANYRRKEDEQDMTNQTSAEAVQLDVSVIRDILHAIEKESGRCRELARMGDPDGAEDSLARARDLYSELLAAVDFENPVHRSVTRNRRADLGTMAADVELCRLKKETDMTRLQKKKAGA